MYVAQRRQERHPGPTGAPPRAAAQPPLLAACPPYASVTQPPLPAPPIYRPPAGAGDGQGLPGGLRRVVRRSGHYQPCGCHPHTAGAAGRASTWRRAALPWRHPRCGGWGAWGCKGQHSEQRPTCLAAPPRHRPQAWPRWCSRRGRLCCGAASSPPLPSRSLSTARAWVGGWVCVGTLLLSAAQCCRSCLAPPCLSPPRPCRPPLLHRHLHPAEKVACGAPRHAWNG